MFRLFVGRIAVVWWLDDGITAVWFVWSRLMSFAEENALIHLGLRSSEQKNTAFCRGRAARSRQLSFRLHT